MPWTQSSANIAPVYHPGLRNKPGCPPGAAAFVAGIGRPATSAERTSGGMNMAEPLSSLNSPFTTNSAADGIQTAPGATPTNGAALTQGGSQSTTSQGGSRIEEATTGLYDESPQHAASGVLANKSNGMSPTATSQSRGPILPVDPEEDVTRLKARLREGGADIEAVNLCDEVFKDGVTIEALQKRLTRNQCNRLHLRDGKQFQMFLGKVELIGETKNSCRLCSANGAKVYKNHRDALRHFLKEHFGLSFTCTRW